MTKGHTWRKDDVDDALAAANTALATLSPTIQQQVTQAQQQIDDSAAAVQVCHAQDGIDTRAALQSQVDTHEESLATCQGELEGLTQEANAQCAIAEDCLCDEANERVAGKTEVCNTRTEVYEVAYCEHHLACTEHVDCHSNEIAVYNALRVDIESEIATIQQEYITVEQSTCLMGLITAAMSSSPYQPIDAAAMVACNNVDASAISINYPAMPADPAACPAAAIGNPQCVGAECEHLHNMDVVAGTFGHYGLDYSGSPSDSECSATCTADPQCTAWVRQPSTGNCWISNQAVVNFEADSDRTTGLRCN